MPAMALLDRNGVYGAPRFHMAAQKIGLRAHIGAEVTVDDTLFGEAGPVRCWWNHRPATRISAA